MNNPYLQVLRDASYGVDEEDYEDIEYDSDEEEYGAEESSHKEISILLIALTLWMGWKAYGSKEKSSYKPEPKENYGSFDLLPVTIQHMLVNTGVSKGKDKIKSIFDYCRFNNSTIVRRDPDGSEHSFGCFVIEPTKESYVVDLKYGNIKKAPWFSESKFSWKMGSPLTQTQKNLIQQSQGKLISNRMPIPTGV